MTDTISAQTHVARGATFIFAQGFLTSVLGVIYVWFLLHTKDIAGTVLFTESDFGLFTILSFILSLTSSIGVIALRKASIKYISHYLARGKNGAASSVVSRVLQVSILTSLTQMALLLVLAGVLSNALNSSILIFYLLPAASVFQIFYFQAQGFLQGLQKMRDRAIIGLIETGFRYSISVILVYLGFGVLGIAFGWLSSYLLSCAISLFVTFRYIKFSAHVHELKSLLIFSFPIYVSMLLTLIVNWVDQIFVLPFMGIDALGVYSLAVRASVVPGLVSTAIGISLFPKLSELHSKSGVEGLRGAFEISTRYAALLGFPTSLLVGTLAYPIIVLFATVRYAGAVIPFTVMCIAALPTILGSAINPTFFTLNRTKMASLITVFVILSQVILSYVFLAQLSLGLVGVAFSRMVAAFIGFALGSYILWLSLKVGFDREALWKSAVASIVMVLSIMGIELLRAITQPLSYEFLVLRLRLLPIYAAVGVFVYILSLILLKAVKRRDIELLHDYLPSRLQWIADLFGRFTRLRNQKEIM
ncbi:MAG: oligosaccharide flippase family protein [Candidatus Bathyarchaeota archaeon]|nr:MAG: oligosaccharide flippase family protein [Candidatus Bathyarchaeota archaeon]